MSVMEWLLPNLSRLLGGGGGTVALAGGEGTDKGTDRQKHAQLLQSLNWDKTISVMSLATATGSCQGRLGHYRETDK